MNTATKTGAFKIISKGQGALHIEGFIPVKTVGPQWGQDSDKIEERSFVPYSAENHCAAVTKIQYYRYVWKSFDTVEEAADYLAGQKPYKKVCAKCLAAVGR